MPDLTGLSAREALRRLSLCQVSARIEGMGHVVHQEPAPGTPLPIRGICRVWCATVDPGEITAAEGLTRGSPVSLAVAAFAAASRPRAAGAPARIGEP